MVSQAPVYTCLGENFHFFVSISQSFPLRNKYQMSVDEETWNKVFLSILQLENTTLLQHTERMTYASLRSSRRGNNKKITLPLMAAILFRHLFFCFKECRFRHISLNLYKINLNDLRRKRNSCDFMSFIFIRHPITDRSANG